MVGREADTMLLAQACGLVGCDARMLCCHGEYLLPGGGFKPLLLEPFLQPRLYCLPRHKAHALPWEVGDLGSNFTSLSGWIFSEMGSSILVHGGGRPVLSDILSWHLEGFNEETITRLVWSRQGIGGTRKEDSLSRACLPNGGHWGVGIAASSV